MKAASMIPGYPSDVTNFWLAGVLGRSGAPVQVADVDVSPVGTGQTGATFRVTARYVEKTADLPDSFILKLPAADEAVRSRVAPGYRSECAFYESVADRIAIPTPQCFYREIADEGAAYVLLLADQAPAVQGDQISGCGRQQALLAVQALAGLHGPTWCDPTWRDFPALPLSLNTDDAITGFGEIARMSADITLEKLGAKVSAVDAETLVAAMSLVSPWLRHAPGRFALLHGDYRLDNMLFSTDGDRITVVDWQTLDVGLAARDLAYFSGTSLEPKLRVAIEEELVAEYVRELQTHGVSDYDEQTCWHDYRWGMVQSLLLIALGCAFAVDTERGDEMFVTMLRRGCQAIRDLDTLAFIRQHAS